MNQSVLTLTPGGLALARSLGFTAAAVQVDNYTSSYVTLRDVGRVIPPWTYGAVVALPDGIRQANAVLTPTVPAVPGPPVPVSQAILTWTDQPLSADPGHLLQQAGYGLQTVVGTVQATAGTTSTGTFTVPAGTQAIGVAVWASGSFRAPDFVFVQGTQTGLAYIDINNANDSRPQWALFDTADDFTVDVQMLADPVSPAKMTVLASTVLPVVDVAQSQGTDLRVIVSGSGPPLVPQSIFHINNNIVAGGNLVLVAAAAGQLVILNQLNFEQTAAVATNELAVQDTSGGALHGFDMATISHSKDFGGLMLGGGLGVRLANGGAVTVGLRGSLTYSIQ